MSAYAIVNLKEEVARKHVDSEHLGVSFLPNFNLFTWFFVIPGALLVLLAGWACGRSTK